MTTDEKVELSFYKRKCNRLRDEIDDLLPYSNSIPISKLKEAMNKTQGCDPLKEILIKLIDRANQ